MLAGAAKDRRGQMDVDTDVLEARSSKLGSGRNRRIQPKNQS